MRKGLRNAERPNPRARRTRRGRVVERIARDAVAGIGVEAQDLAGRRIDQLRAERADVLLRGPDDAVGQRL